ncbi:hypothetical protein [Coleofasciculus sp. FACHB-712]|nr:hypothetical protein [Coleofasciculus sp. FACHB-712]
MTKDTLINSSTPEFQWEQLEIPGLFAQIQEPLDEAEEDDENKDN